jgi:hypothetical protein
MPLASISSPTDQSGNETVKADDAKFDLSDPPLFALYSYLRKLYKSIRMEQPKVSTSSEAECIMKSAITYELMGCPSLALDILRSSADIVDSAITEKMASLYTAPVKTGASAALKPMSDEIDWSQPVSSDSQKDTSNAFDWSKPVSSADVKDTSDAFDWSQPVSVVAETKDTADAFDWSQPVAKNDNSLGFDWSQPVSSTQNDTSGGFDWSQPASSGLDWGEPVSKPPDDMDDYEAFKKSLFTGTTEAENIEEDLDLLGEQGEAFKKEEMQPHDKEPMLAVTDPKILFYIEFEKLKLRSFMWTLAMKIAQPICRSAACVSLNYDILQKDSTIKEYFERLADGLKTLAQLCYLPPQVLDRVVT